MMKKNFIKNSSPIWRLGHAKNGAMKTGSELMRQADGTKALEMRDVLHAR